MHAVNALKGAPQICMINAINALACALQAHTINAVNALMHMIDAIDNLMRTPQMHMVDTIDDLICTPSTPSDRVSPIRDLDSEQTFSGIFRPYWSKKRIRQEWLFVDEGWNSMYKSL